MDSASCTLDELRGHVEGERALVVGDQRFGLRGDVLRGLQAVLAFPAAFEEVRDAQIELHGFVKVVRGEMTGLKNRKELRVRGEDGIGPQVCGDFQSLVLLNGGARRFQIVVVLQRHLNGLVQTDAHGAMHLPRRSILRRSCGRGVLRRGWRGGGGEVCAAAADARHTTSAGMANSAVLAGIVFNL